MPTVLLVDVSLSMARQSSVKSGLNQGDPGSGSALNINENSGSSTDLNGAITKKALAVHSIYRFLDCLGHQAKLEYVSLVSCVCYILI